MDKKKSHNILGITNISEISAKDKHNISKHAVNLFNLPCCFRI